jgi:hypothetical protein
MFFLKKERPYKDMVRIVEVGRGGMGINKYQ